MMERRFDSSALEVRRAATLEARQGKLVGYAAVFGAESRELPPGFVEVIRPGAFTRSLESEDAAGILALAGHDLRQVLGRVGAGTLQLAEDSKGLRYSITMPDTQTARDLTALVERGDIQGASFGFRVRNSDAEAWDFSTRPARREVIEAELLEISITALPAYTDTSVAQRSLERHAGTGSAWRRAALERFLEVHRS